MKNMNIESQKKLIENYDLEKNFNGFLKDLDEVRIGVLKHLHDFLKVTFKSFYSKTLDFHCRFRVLTPRCHQDRFPCVP